MNPRVKRKNGSVWIDAVDKLVGWANGEENTFMGSFRVALSALGEDVTYDQLMGLSGAAFRIQMAMPLWCPSASDATVGFDCAETAATMLGYRWIAFETFEQSPDSVSVEEMRQAIVSSIDLGCPVLALNLEGSMDWGVITGYEYEGQFLLCRTYVDEEDEYSEAREWPCVIRIPVKTAEFSPGREGIVASLRIAVALAKAHGFGAYASGFAAYENWIRDLTDDARFKSLDRKQTSTQLHANAWCFYSLYDARCSAARYLGSAKEHFEAPLSDEMAAAEDLYTRLALCLGKGQKNAPFPSQLRESPWRKELRLAEAKVLEETLDLERQGIARLQAVVEACGGEH